VRGIERSRYFRCAGCGSEWQTQSLFCPFCGTTDHRELASLIAEQGGLNSAVDACNRCLGYVKAFTRLQGTPPEGIILEDLASVELDVAAADAGYKRPHGAGYILKVRVTQNGGLQVSA
jgi:FdhE protein